MRRQRYGYKFESLEARLRALELKPDQASDAVAKARAAVAFVWGSLHVYRFRRASPSPRPR